MKRKIYVNKHAVKRNHKHGTKDPVVSVRTYKGVTTCHSVEIPGASVVKYSPITPLSCGARVWIETLEEVKVFDYEGNEVGTV